ncbi:helix-turn-helix domain-containing protein [Streptomyces sp. NPDC032940]|uniref:helix-turn-helix domain-containing protein n=1 Tax=Streptomyces sp. NPDC032940 TaxID=3155366 RepID=UPI0033ED8D9B
MANERLRAAMAAGGWTHDTLAQEIGIDPKSVERWVNKGRTPRQRTALLASEALGEDIHALWPALRQPRKARAISPDLVALYAQRADLPIAVYAELFAQAHEQMEVLVYAGVFLHEGYPRLNELIKERATAGCRVRIAVGKADSEAVQQRGREERFGHGIEFRCRLALLHYRPLLSVPGVQIRTHSTTLYNSIYRADDQMLVNGHVFGVNAYGAPVWQLRRTETGGLFDTYASSFDAVWSTAQPVED